MDIDILKSVAIVMVVLYHLGVPLSYRGGGILSGYYLRSFLSACVPLFFFSSGVLYAKRTLSVKRALQKVLSLAIPLVFWALCSAAMFRWLHGEAISLKWMLLDAVTLRLQYSNWLWFIPVISGVYLCAPFILGVRDASTKLFNSLVLLLCVFAFGLDTLEKTLGYVDVLVGSEFGGKVYTFISRYSLLTTAHPEALAFFAVGVWIEGRERKVPSTPRVLVALVLAPIPLAVLGFSTQALTGREFDVTWNGYSSLPTLIIVVALYFLARYVIETVRSNSLALRLVGFIGANSMSVYILHWFARPVVSAAVAAAGVGVALKYVLVPIVVLACAAIGNVMRKSPAKVLLP